MSVLAIFGNHILFVKSAKLMKPRVYILKIADGREESKPLTFSLLSQLIMSLSALSVVVGNPL